MTDARRSVGAVAVATLLALLALPGCTPDDAAAPTPSPTTAVPTPAETAQERQERLDYAAAEKSYRTFRAEYNRVLRAGGAKEPTAVMKATAGGSYLKELATVVEAYREVDGHDTGRENIKYVNHVGYSPSELVLDVCEDGRSITSISPIRRIPGEVRTARLTMRRVDHRWKIWQGTGKKVKSCA